jgi:hypothetical protein
MRGRITFGTAGAVIALVIAAGVAQAEPSTPAQPTFAPTAEPTSADVREPASEPATETNYRLSMVTTNAVAGGLLVGTLALDGTIPTNVAIPMVIAGDVGVVFGGAIVHLAHGEPKRALASIAMRGGLALLGASIGSAVPCDGDWCKLGTMGGGAAVGVGAAAILETIFLTNQTVTREAPQRGWTPIVAASPAGGQVGLAGAF